MTWSTDGARTARTSARSSSRWSDRLPHDLIDPGNPDQNTELVYPVVDSALITG